MTGRGGTGGGLRAGVADPKKISGELFRYSVYFFLVVMSILVNCDQSLTKMYAM